MTRFESRIYSGKSSASRAGTILVDPEGYLTLEGGGLPQVHFRDLRVSPRVGNSARYLDLPNGVRIETIANAEVDRLEKRWSLHRHRFIHRLENNSKAIAFSVLALLGGLYGFLVYGAPALSRLAVYALPISLDDRLGSEALQQMDSSRVFSPSSLPEARREGLRALFRSLYPDDGQKYRLGFRASELLGANALALPGGQVIFTDQFVTLTDDDEMLAAIMLHEIGHIAERHSMQTVMYRAGLSVVVFALTGDLDGVASELLVIFPSVLFGSRYSRELEWDADTYALDRMSAIGMNTSKFADMMERLVQAEESEEGSLSRYFSTHPASEVRIARFRDAADP